MMLEKIGLFLLGLGVCGNLAMNVLRYLHPRGIARTDKFVELDDELDF